MRLNKTLKVCGVYSIINTINGFEYIGSTKLIYRRISEHFSMLRGNKHTNEHLQHAYNKYGEAAFEVKILEVCTLEKLHEREEYYISITPNKYNFNEKPTGPLKLPTPTEKRIEIVRQKLTGRKRTAEQRKRFSESHKGLKQSEESKQKRSDALKEFYSIEENKHYPTEESLAKSRETFLENHPDGRRVKWATLICLFEGCKKEFEVLPYLAKIRQYCSRDCKIKDMIGQEVTQEHRVKLSQSGKAFYATEEGKKHLEKLQKATKEYFENNKIPMEIRTCLCGCGESFEVKATSKKRYIFKHFKIKKQSEESNRKRRESMKRFLETPEGQEYKKDLIIVAERGRKTQQILRQQVKSNAN